MRPFIFLLLLLPSIYVAEENKTKELKYNLNEDGTHYIKLTALNQVWVRYNESNPGTTVFGKPQSSTFDIGIRRLRFQLYGQLTDKLFFYTQFGQNNFNYLSKLYTGAFFHDALAEYKVKDKYLSIGGGLTGWSGLSRFASPSVASILGLDAPLYQQTTNGVTDQFLRKLSLYAKGKLGKLDYRLALTTPMATQNSSAALNTLSKNAEFALTPPKPQIQGYFMYQFLDKESNLTPYTAGSYLGTKRVLTIGAGFINQDKAMWKLNNSGDTLYQAMQLLGIDLFYDAPINNDKGNAISLYVAYNNFNLGTNYLRNLGVMNPANGINANASFNGPGDAFPMIGSGNIIYAQSGYLFKNNLLPNNGTIQAYGSLMYGNFNRLKDPSMVYELGINILVHGTNSAKITFGYQNRPIFKTDALNGGIYRVSRKGMYVLQYQLFI